MESLNAANRFGNSGDLGSLLERAFREKRIQLFGRNDARLPEPPNRDLFIRRMLLAEMLQHLPVRIGQGTDTFFFSDCCGNLLVPLRCIGKVSLFVHIDSGSGYSLFHEVWVVGLNE